MSTKPTAIAFLDTETSGLDYEKCEILELAIIKTDVNGALIEEPFNSRYKMTRPENAAPRALEINGYTAEKWKDTVPFADHAPKIAEMLRGCYLAAFNTTFDESFLLQYIPKPTWDYHHYEFSTHALDLFFAKKIERPSLWHYAAYYFLDQGKVHTALNDANILREIYLKKRAV